jgi:hypothetical protein
MIAPIHPDTVSVVDTPEGPLYVATLRAPVAWVPWPTAPGFWWCSTPIEPAPQPCEAHAAGNGFEVYFCGSEVETFANEPHEGWLFAPLGPLPEAPRR